MTTEEVRVAHTHPEVVVQRAVNTEVNRLAIFQVVAVGSRCRTLEVVAIHQTG